ncbi:MAG: diguanylate cyclase [Sandaracinaceae bacterium]|nr:diguanylate cyclase [Sandaracinaceae bacterium]
MIELQDAEDAKVVALGLLEAAPDAVLVIRSGGTIALANQMAERLFGYERAQLIGMPVEQLVPVAEREGFAQRRARFERSGRARFMGDPASLEAVRRSGERVPVEVGLSPVDTTIGRLTIAIVRDVTHRRALERQLRHASSHDALTGLFNRTHLEACRAQLEGKAGQIGVILMDIDGLKDVNDAYGHDAGDQFIKRMGVVLRATAAPEDVPTRLGGDEFAILVPHTDADGLADKVRLLLSELTRHNDIHRGQPLAFSHGAALTEQCGGVALAMRVADRRMYEDKRKRRRARGLPDRRHTPPP